MMIIYILQRLWLAPPPDEPATEGRGIKLLEGIIEVVDGTIRFVANTISFIRIAAFAFGTMSIPRTCDPSRSNTKF